MTTFVKQTKPGFVRWFKEFKKKQRFTLQVVRTRTLWNSLTDRCF